MRKPIIFLLVIANLAGVSLAPVAAFALEKPEFGGNNSAEYQPPTGNPQNNTLTGLQPNNNTGLQPATTGINPESLIQAGGLQVLTSSDKGATSTARDKAEVQPHSALPTWIAGGLLTLLAVIYIVAKPDKQKPSPTEVPSPAASPQAQKSQKPKTAKKTTRKKRKAARR